MKTTLPGPSIDDAVLRALASAAGLELSPQRCAALQPVVHRTRRMLGALWAVDANETVPADTFDPRWRFCDDKRAGSVAD